MSALNSIALKRFFDDFQQFYKGNAEKKLVKQAKTYLRKGMKVPSSFTDKFYSDLVKLKGEGRQNFIQNAACTVLGLIGENRFKSLPRIDEKYQRSKKEDTDIDSLLDTTSIVDFKGFLQAAAKEMEERPRSVPVKQQIYTLKALFFKFGSDQFLTGSGAPFQEDYATTQEFIDALENEYEISEYKRADEDQTLEELKERTEALSAKEEEIKQQKNELEKSLKEEHGIENIEEFIESLEAETPNKQEIKGQPYSKTSSNSIAEETIEELNPVEEQIEEDSYSENLSTAPHAKSEASESKEESSVSLNAPGTFEISNIEDVTEASEPSSKQIKELSEKASEEAAMPSEETVKALNEPKSFSEPVVVIEDRAENPSEPASQSAYPAEDEDEEEDPSLLENKPPRVILNSDYVTGQLKKQNNYWNFYPLYEWKEGVPRFIDNARSLYPDYGNINLADLIQGSSDSKKLLPGCLYNIEPKNIKFSVTGQERENTRCVIDARELFYEKQIWRADIDETDGDYRRAYYVVEPVALSGWSFSDQSIRVKIAGSEELPDELSGLVRTYVLMKLGDAYIGPLQLSKNGVGSLVVTPRSGAHLLYIYDAFTIKRGYPWQADAIKTDPPLEIVFTNPLVTTTEEVDLITDIELVKLASREIPKERAYIQELERWLQELPSYNGEAESQLTNARIRKLKKILATNKRVSEVLPSLVPTVAKLFTSEVEDKEKFVKDVAQAISENEEAIALLHPQPAFIKALKGLESKKEDLEHQIDELNKEYDEEKVRHEQEVQLTDEAKEIEKLEKQIEDLKKDLARLQGEQKKEEEKLQEKRAIIADSESQLQEFNKNLDETVDKVASLAFEGSITAKIMEAASRWHEERDASSFKLRVEALRNLQKSTKSGAALNDELCTNLKKIRNYHTNEYVNLFVCTAQSFLTVLSGSPGSGKTSLCNYLARIFGLTTIMNKPGISKLWPDHPNYANRYIPISVERGWTSKRDMIGYFNPLSRSFESVDPHRFECFKQLDSEAKEKFEDLPYFLLLDEANLSPMEYYFADFMNICDERNDLSFISLGGDRRFQVPDSLRFFATINNDHTTEMLSPRLVDRTWIIQLPDTDKLDSSAAVTEKIFEKANLIDWVDFRRTYSPKSLDRRKTNPLQKKLDDIAKMFKPLGIVLSPRSRMAISNYMSVAQEYMVADGGLGPEEIAMDFAISQKILPTISGAGDNYREELENLLHAVQNKKLPKSSATLDRIIDKGVNAMGFFRFF